MLKTSEIEKILSYANMPKLENILTPQLITRVNTIYKITNIVNGKCYIGQTSKMTIERWQEHIRDLRKGTHHSHKLQNAYNKYGEENFTFEVKVCTLSSFLDEKEIDWIDRFDSYYNGYNETLGGDGFTSEAAKIAQNRPDVRAKKSEAMKVSAKIAQNRPDVRAKKSKSMKGKTLSDSHKAKILAATKGKSHNVKKSYVRLTKEQCIIIAEQMLKGEFNSFAECARFYNVDSATIRDMFNYKYCRKSCRQAIIELCKKYNYPMRGLEVT